MNAAVKKTVTKKKLKALDLILDAFEKLSAVPRESKHEEKIREYLLEWAKRCEFTHKEDEIGNILIKVPAFPGWEDKPAVIIQGHMDMVCEKTPDSTHDFATDPIRFIYEEDWLRADKTTLGADNGIAIAMAMVLAEDPKLKHPPLELLFTVDEETGLTGAQNLQPGFFTGKYLLNIDSEDEGVFTVGCAGGKDTHINLDLEYESVPEGSAAFCLSISGLAGGHSGVNIHEERANAIHILSRTMQDLFQSVPVRMIHLTGGTAHNAIPRDARCTFFVQDEQIEYIQTRVKQLEPIFQAENQFTDPDLMVNVTPFLTLQDNRAMTIESTETVIDLLNALPHGVAQKSVKMPELVETSNNLAKITVDAGQLLIETSQRSSVMSRLEAITNKIEAIARLAGAQVSSGNGYPSWQPDFDAPLVKLCEKVYKKTFKKEAKVEAIHAGLECGLIGNTDPNLQMISIGPTIQNPHSPQERIQVSTIEKVWKFLLALLKTLD